MQQRERSSSRLQASSVAYGMSASAGRRSDQAETSSEVPISAYQEATVRASSSVSGHGQSSVSDAGDATNRASEPADQRRADHGGEEPQAAQPRVGRRRGGRPALLAEPEVPTTSGTAA